MTDVTQVKRLAICWLYSLSLKQISTLIDMSNYLIHTLERAEFHCSSNSRQGKDVMSAVVRCKSVSRRKRVYFFNSSVWYFKSCKLPILWRCHFVWWLNWGDFAQSVVNQKLLSPIWRHLSIGFLLSGVGKSQDSDFFVSFIINKYINSSFHKKLWWTIN